MKREKGTKNPSKFVEWVLEFGGILFYQQGGKNSKAWNDALIKKREAKSVCCEWKRGKSEILAFREFLELREWLLGLECLDCVLGLFEFGSKAK